MGKENTQSFFLDPHCFHLFPSVTLCSAAEFQCKDGSCITNSSRCNQVADCEDASDEMNCSKYYSKEIWAGNQKVACLIPTS